MTFHVGKPLADNPKRNFTYSMVRYKDGWADVKDYLPAEFDLCWLKIRGKNACAGWYCGSSWEGMKIKPTDEICCWKLLEDK